VVLTRQFSLNDTLPGDRRILRNGSTHHREVFDEFRHDLERPPE